MAVKLHRCGTQFVKGPHPCWQVQHALDEAGIEYELAPGPSFPRSRRKETIAKTGQKLYPWLEFEDGTVLRLESKELVERIRSGMLFAGQGSVPAH